MDAYQIFLLVIYLIGLATNVTIFFIQKAQIKKMKGVTDHVEQYFKIFDLAKVKEYVEVNKKASELKTNMAIKKAAEKIGRQRSKDFMDRTGNRVLAQWRKEFLEGEMNDRFNEIGYFALGFIAMAPKEEREAMIDDLFPVNADILKIHLKNIEDDPESYGDIKLSEKPG